MKNKVEIEKHNKVNSKSMTSLHCHGYFELYFLTEGKRKYFINDTIYPVDINNIVIIPPGILHRTIGKKEDTYSRVLIYINNDVLKENVLKELYNQRNTYIYVIPQKRLQYIRELTDKIEYEINKNDEFSQSLINSYTNELIIFLLRLNFTDISAIAETDLLINTAAKYIRSNFSRTITLKETAAKVKLSENYFSKLFKEKTGFGFAQYLIDIRLSEASKLLTDTNFSITEIAYRCGFNDSSYFTYQFKKHKGVTPFKFRKYGLN